MTTSRTAGPARLTATLTATASLALVPLLLGTSAARADGGTTTVAPLKDSQRESTVAGFAGSSDECSGWTDPTRNLWHFVVPALSAAPSSTDADIVSMTFNGQPATGEVVQNGKGFDVSSADTTVHSAQATLDQAIAQDDAVLVLSHTCAATGTSGGTSDGGSGDTGGTTGGDTGSTSGSDTGGGSGDTTGTPAGGNGGGDGGGTTSQGSTDSSAPATNGAGGGVTIAGGPVAAPAAPAAPPAQAPTGLDGTTAAPAQGGTVAPAGSPVTTSASGTTGGASAGAPEAGSAAAATSGRATTGATAASSGTGLPFTGSPIGVLGLLGGGALAAGVALQVAGRSRTRRTRNRA